MTIVDLSLPLATGMPVYPGDPEVTVEPALAISECGVEVHRLHLGTHSGTHLDAPSHTVTGGRTVDEIALDRLVGPTLVIDGRAAVDGFVTLESVGPLPEQVPERVFVCTGWDAHWGADEMTRHPGLAPELVEELWARGMRLIGVDALSPDPTGSEDFPVHGIVLGRDGLIVENLAGLTPLVGRTIDAALMPLRWVGLDGSPIRAWASVEEAGA